MALALATTAAACVALYTAPGRGAAGYAVPFALAGLIPVSLALRARGVPGPWVLFAVALALRLPFVGVPPWLSDDLFRYLVEGAALGAGLDVFTTPPAALPPEVGAPWRGAVNHPDLGSIYPPLALLWFRLAAALGSVEALRAITALADASVVLVLARRGRPLGLAWAVHPLAVLESAAGTHLESPAVALAALGLLAPRGVAATGTLAAAGVKLLPVLWLPALLRRAPREAALASVGLGLVGLVAAWPVLGAGPALFASLGTYARHWTFDPALHGWLAPWLPGTRPLLGLVGLAVVAEAAWRRRPLAEAWLRAALAFLLLTPTAHPWYALWLLVPALWLRREGLVLLCGWRLASYAVLFTWDEAVGAWEEPAGLWWLTWGVPAGVALARAVWRRRLRAPR